MRSIRQSPGYSRKLLVKITRNTGKIIAPRVFLCYNKSVWKIGIRRKEMYLEKETREKFGHSLDTLSAKSGKEILLECDYCKCVFQTTPKRRLLAHSVIKTDSCNKCKYIKMKEMNKIKYGVDNVFQLESVKEKSRQTLLDKYGVESTCHLESNIAARKKTWEERGGEIRDKFKKTCLDKYGVENPSMLRKVREKAENTTLERFGKRHYLTTDKCREQYKEKIGSDNIFKTEGFKERLRKKNIEKYGVDNRMKVPELAKINGQKSLKTKIERGDVKIYKDKLISEWANEIGFSRSAFNGMVNKYGWDVAVDMTPRMSSLELEMEKILKDIGVEYLRQVKIGSCYADFIIGDLIVECDGLYWHSENHKDDNYHSERLSFYEKNNYRALFFREDEILSSPEIVKSIITNKLGLSKRIYARKCKIERISKKESKAFLAKNHLMGNGRGDSIGLTYNGEIVALFQFVKIKDGYELSRFATKTGISVTGGFSRLLLSFLRDYKPEKFITFVDRRYGKGDHLVNFGFKKESEHNSFRWTNSRETLHRMKFRSNSGYEKGYYKIWDCGQAKYVYRGVYSSV